MYDPNRVLVKKGHPAYDDFPGSDKPEGGGTDWSGAAMPIAGGLLGILGDAQKQKAFDRQRFSELGQIAASPVTNQYLNASSLGKAPAPYEGLLGGAMGGYQMGQDYQKQQQENALRGRFLASKEPQEQEKLATLIKADAANKDMDKLMATVGANPYASVKPKYGFGF